MAENLIIADKGSKKDKYETLLPQIRSLITGEEDLIANLANITAAIHQTFDFLWTGFYLVKNDELVLGPFQGPIACTHIAFGKGVCGTAWKNKETVIVPDVDQFPGHIACSSLSKSEIVVPVIKNGEVKMILDIDSAELNQFDKTDQEYLEKITNVIKID